MTVCSLSAAGCWLLAAGCRLLRLLATARDEGTASDLSATAAVYIDVHPTCTLCWWLTAAAAASAAVTAAAAGAAYATAAAAASNIAVQPHSLPLQLQRCR